MKNIWSHKHI